MTKYIITILAVLNGFGNVAFAQEPSKSSSAMEARVSTRRAERIRQEQSNMQIVPAHTQSILSSLELRREQRRAQRLSNEPLPIKRVLVDAVNMERAKMGLSALRFNILLEKSAQAHAQDMKTRDYFAHINPDGLHSQQRIKATGYGVINAQKCHCHYSAHFGENLAKGQTTVKEVVRDWMESPPHREAILERDFTDIGVGIIDDLWVLNFGGIDISGVND